MIDLLSLFPDHPLWRDFKHISVTGKVLLIFSPGCGGNFLLPQLINNPPICRGNATFNEYMPRISESTYQYKFFGIIGKKQNTTKISLEDIDILYNQFAVEAETVKINGYYDIFGSHGLPMLYYNVFTVNIDEVIYITLTEQSDRFCDLLQIIKNNFYSDFNSKSHQTSKVLVSLAKAIENSKISPSQVVSIIQPSTGSIVNKMLVNHFKSPLLTDPNNLIVWLFIIHSISQKLKFTVDNFINFASLAIMSPRGYSYINLINEKLLAKKYNINVNYIDYFDLFFTRNTQYSHSMSIKNEIETYTNRNIQLLSEIKKLVNTECQCYVDSVINSLPRAVN